MPNRPKLIILLAFAFMLFNGSILYAQQKDSTNEMNEIITKAFFPFEQGSGAIYFNKVVYDLKDPLSIFSTPNEDAYLSCFYVFNGNKFAINLGEIQAMSDGQVFMSASLINAEMYIDSMHTENPITKTKPTYEDVVSLFKDDFGDDVLTDLGQETVNKVLCRKIKAGFSASKDYVLLWVDAKTNKLVLMADYQDKAFDVYWIKSMTNVPAEYDFSMSLPSHEIQNLAGFTVMDMRFADKKLNQTIE